MTHHRRWLSLLVGLVLICGVGISARPIVPFSYGEMIEKSEIVVIATPVARKALPEHTTMPGVLRGNDPIPAVQIETTFQVKAMLRGSLPEHQEQFVLLHLIEADPPAGLGRPVNAQELVDFRPNSRDEYLMFLKRDADGRYEAVNGQTDPAFSIKLLTNATSTTQRAK